MGRGWVGCVACPTKKKLCTNSPSSRIHCEDAASCPLPSDHSPGGRRTFRSSSSARKEDREKSPIFFGGLGGGIILCRSLSKESELSQTKLKQARGEKIIEHKRSCVHLVGNRIVCDEITLGENTVLSD